MKIKIIATLLMAGFCSASYAQKSSPDQKNSLRAPVNVRVDGKLNEWNDKFQTYSHHTQFYYTVSNDNRYFYLTVHAEYEEIVNRALKGGITLTINKSGTRKDPQGIHITYPFMDYFRINRKEAPKIESGAEASVARLDSFVNAVNAQLQQKTKMIKVIGIKGLDTLISIYNLDGLKAAALLDQKMNYNYELAVSLDDLGMDINNPVKFAYQVMINEVEDKTVHGVFKDGSQNGITFTVTSDRTAGQDATDFWGEYVLAK